MAVGRRGPLPASRPGTASQLAPLCPGLWRPPDRVPFGAGQQGFLAPQPPLPISASPLTPYPVSLATAPPVTTRGLARRVPCDLVAGAVASWLPQQGPGSPALPRLLGLLALCCPVPP